MENKALDKSGLTYFYKTYLKDKIDAISVIQEELKTKITEEQVLSQEEYQALLTKM